MDVEVHSLLLELLPEFEDLVEWVDCTFLRRAHNRNYCEDWHMSIEAMLQMLPQGLCVHPGILVDFYFLDCFFSEAKDAG